MTSLPIAQKPSQQSGNTANALLLNATPDTQTARGMQRSGGTPASGADAAQAKVGAGSPVEGDSPAVIAEPFSKLLARQIGEAGSLAPNKLQDSLAVDAATDDAGTTAKEVQDPTMAAAIASGDAASVLAAMLQQIPAAMAREQGSDGRSSATMTQGSGEIRPVSEGSGTALINGSGEVGQLMESRIRQTADSLPSAENSLQKADIRQQIDPAGLSLQSTGIALPEGIVDHAEIEVASPASQPQTGTAQAITSSALSAVLPNMPSYNAAGSTQTITTPLGNNGWADEFSQKISWMSTQQNQVAELHLTPPDLGPVDIVLKISGNQATALFTSPHSAVRDAMENALPKLRETLAENGIMLGNATVSDQSPRERGADGQMNQGFGAAAQRAIFDGTSNSIGLPSTIPENGPTRRHNGMIDTFA